MVTVGKYFFFALLCLIFIPFIISFSLKISAPVSIVIYIVILAINFIMSAYALHLKYSDIVEGPYNLKDEQTSDMDRCLYFMFLGPLGTILIASNIILNIINKLCQTIEK